MVTLWDWLTVLCFFPIAITYLSRSMGDVVPGDRLIHYLAPAALLAIANWLGNGGRYYLAIAALVSAAAVFCLVIKPFRVG